MPERKKQNVTQTSADPEYAIPCVSPFRMHRTQYRGYKSLPVPFSYFVQHFVGYLLCYILKFYKVSGFPFKDISYRFWAWE